MPSKRMKDGFKSRRQEVIDFFEECPGSLTSEDISNMTGCDSNVYAPRITELLKEGVLEYTGYKFGKCWALRLAKKGK